MTNHRCYLDVQLDSGDRITIYRSSVGIRDLVHAIYVPARGTPRAIDDLVLEDDAETLSRLRAPSLRMWLTVRLGGVVAGLFASAPASGRAEYA